MAGSIGWEPLKDAGLRRGATEVAAAGERLRGLTGGMRQWANGREGLPASSDAG
jgi:hypothetical protein